MLIGNENKNIIFIGAHDKGLSFHIGKRGTSGGKRFVSRDYKVLAKTIFEHGIDEDCIMSSSLDFAKEEGFRTDNGARKLLNRAIKFQNKHLNNKVHFTARKLYTLVGE